MQYELHTPRLLMRPFLPEDAPHLYELNSDPDVVRYTGDGPYERLRQVEEFIAGYDVYARYGCGRLAVVRKGDGAFLGWSGLKCHPDKDGAVDVGFRLHKRFWGQGYATESALAAIGYGFGVMELPSVFACASPDNPASIRVLEKCGLQYWKKTFEVGMDWSYYLLGAAEWDATRSASSR